MSVVTRGLGLAGLGALLALCACVSTHPSSPEAPAPQPPTPPAEVTRAPQPPAPPAEVTRAPPSPPTTPDHPPAQTADTATAAGPACTCLDTKAKPKPKPRSRVVRQEAPPQLRTAPIVEQTPPGGLIDAQVRSMSVPVMSILGKRVRGAKGEDLGRVVDVLTDASGRVRTAIIDFGGFLGVGNHRIAVDWPLLRFNPDGTDPSLLLSLSPEKLRTAPEYKDNPRPQILMLPAATTTAPTG